MLFLGHSFLAWRVFTGSDRRAVWPQQKVQVGIAGGQVIRKMRTLARILPGIRLRSLDSVKLDL